MSTHSRYQPLVPTMRDPRILLLHPEASSLPIAQFKHNDLEPRLLKLPDELLLRILKLNHAITGTFVDTKSMRQVCTRLDPIGAEVLCRHKPHDGRFKIYVGQSDLHGLKGLESIAKIAQGTRMGMLIPGMTLVYKSAPQDAIYTHCNTRPVTAKTLSSIKVFEQRMEPCRLQRLLTQVFSFIKSIQSITYSQDGDLTRTNARAKFQEGWNEWGMHDLATPPFAFWPIRVLLGAVKDANVNLKQLTLSEVQMLYPTSFDISTQRKLEFLRSWVHQLRNLTSLSLRIATVAHALLKSSLDTDPAYPGPTHLISMLHGLPALKSLNLSSTESEFSAWQLSSILRATFPFRLKVLRLKKCDVFNMDDLAGFIAKHRAAGPFSLTLKNIVVRFVGPTDDGVERLDAWKGLLRSLAKHATADTRLSLRHLFNFWHPLPPFTEANIAVDKVTSRYFKRLYALPHDQTVPELLNAAIKDLKASTSNHLGTTDDF